MFKNFEKMTYFEDSELKETRKSNKDVENLTSQFIEEFRQLDINKREFASYIDSTIENQKYMSSQIRNTDCLIQSKLMLEQRKYEEMVRKLKEQENREKIKQSKQNRRRQLNAELTILQQKYTRFKNVFDMDEQDDIDLETFDETPQFKKFLGNLDIKKTLDQAIFENNIRMKDVKRRIKDMETEKKVSCPLTRYWSWLCSKKTR